MKSVRLQGEMPRIEQMNLGIGNISAERTRTRRAEERIAVSPHREHRGLFGAQVFLPVRIPIDVAPVVEEEIQLQLRVAIENGLVVRQGIRADAIELVRRHAVRVLEAGDLRREEKTKRIASSRA